MIKHSAFASRPRPKSRRQPGKQPSVVEIFRWLFEEFGFAALLLAFSFGSLAVATAMINFSSAREWANYTLNSLHAMENECRLPSIPGNIRARAGWEGSGEIVMSWLASSDVDHYAVAFGRQSGVYEYGSTNVGNGRQYIVRDLEPGKAYYLVVSAENECGSSGFTREVMAVASGTLALTPTSSQQPAASSQGEEINQAREATRAGSLTGQKGQEIAPQITPYYGDLPDELQQDELTTQDLKTPEEQRVEAAAIASNLFAKKGFRQLLLGLGMFAIAAILAVAGMRHIRRAKAPKEPGQVEVHRGQLTDLEEHEIKTPPQAGGGGTMGFGGNKF